MRENYWNVCNIAPDPPKPFIPMMPCLIHKIITFLQGDGFVEMSQTYRIRNYQDDIWYVQRRLDDFSSSSSGPFYYGNYKVFINFIL